MALTLKQESFCLAYLETGNASEAYRRAYSAGKMKSETVTKRASELLADGGIKGRIDELRKPAIEAAQITVERVLKEYARLAFFDPRKLFNEDGTPKAITDLDDDTAAAVAGLEVIEQYSGEGKNRVFVGYLKKYKLADKKGSLDSIGKHLGMFVERTELTGKDGGPLAMQAVLNVTIGKK
jgi:phage terminase small subunit